MKKYLAMLCSLVLCSAALTSCKNTTPDKEKSSVQSSAADEQSSEAEKGDESKVPAEKEEKKSKENIPEIEPIPVPEGGWTDETLNNVIYINGKNVKMPCKFSDFGEGFELVTDDDRVDVDKKTNSLYADCSYNGNCIALLAMSDCTDISEINDKNIRSILCSSDYGGDGFDNYAPISINGVELGSDVKDAEKYLNFDVDRGSDNDYARYKYEKDHLVIWVTSSDAKTVDGINILYKEGK